jgi:hypothetical protein
MKTYFGGPTIHPNVPVFMKYAGQNTQYLRLLFPSNFQMQLTELNINSRDLA